MAFVGVPGIGTSKIDAILHSIGLTPSSYDPCLYSGFVQDPKDPFGSPSSTPLSMGLYVDDFVYFLEDPAVKALFERLLRERIKRGFMGLVEGFLGIHFCESQNLRLMFT